MRRPNSALHVSNTTLLEAQRLGASLDLPVDEVIALALRGLAASHSCPEADRLVATSLDDVDLDDPRIYASSDAAGHLALVGTAMATRYMHSRRVFLLERVDHGGTTYLAIGTRSGPHPRDTSVLVNTYAAPEGLRSIKDAGSDLVVFDGGRQLVATHDRGQSACFIRFVYVEDPCRWRIWTETAGEGRRRLTHLELTIEPTSTLPAGFRVSGAPLVRRDLFERE